MVQPGTAPPGNGPLGAPQPGTPQSGQAEPGQPPAAPVPNPWLPQGGAVLQALDKVNAQTAVLNVKVGQTASFGSLSITVQACVVRPPDMPQNAAAYLTITDSHADQPGFQGWMVKSDPSLSMLQHPIYDVRVMGCTP